MDISPCKYREDIGMSNIHLKLGAAYEFSKLSQQISHIQLLIEGLKSNTETQTLKKYNLNRAPFYM